MEAITHKLIFSVLAFMFASMIAIFAWYIVTVAFWLVYKSNGGTASYLRYLEIKDLHLTKVTKK